MDTGTLMVLKRLIMPALGAVGMMALVAGPLSAQAQIPIPKLLVGGGSTACKAPDMDALEAQDPTMVLSFTSLAGCDDVDDDVDDFRTAWDTLNTAQGNLGEAVKGAMGDPNVAQQANIDFLTDLRNKASAAKDENLGNSLAEAVYAEKDAIDALKTLNDAISMGGGYQEALVAAEAKHHNFVYSYEGENGPTSAYLAGDSSGDDIFMRPTESADQAELTMSLVEMLTAARTTWNELPENDNPYDSDGNLKDYEDLSTDAQDAATALARAERRLADAKKEASAEVTALGNAKAAKKAAEKGVEDAQDAVGVTQKSLSDRAKGVGDSAAIRLAEVQRQRQKAFDEADEDLMEAREELDEEQEDLDDAVDEQEDAASDLESAQDAYDAAVAAEDDLEEDAMQDDKDEAGAAVGAAAAELAAADKAAGDADTDAKSAKDDRDDAQDEVDAESETVAKARKALDEAISGSFSFTDDNPAGDLADALVTQKDTGGALVEAIDATYQKTVDNKTALDAMTDVGADVDANTTAIATNAADIVTLDGSVSTNETGIAANTTAIGVNTMGIATNAAEIVRVEGRVDTNWDAIAVNQMGIDANEMGISMNSDAIGANSMNIASNERNISGNTAMIGELSESLEVVRAGVAASMALAGMPAINGRGISIGVGSFDGESAFAVGFQIQNDTTSFKVGVTSGGGATGASAGVGFQF